MIRITPMVVFSPCFPCLAPVEHGYCTSEPSSSGEAIIRTAHVQLRRLEACERIPSGGEICMFPMSGIHIRGIHQPIEAMQERGCLSGSNVTSDFLYSSRMAERETPEQLRKRIEANHRKVVLDNLTLALLPRMEGKTEKEKKLLAESLAGFLINTAMPFFAEYISASQTSAERTKDELLKKRFVEKMCRESPAYAQQDLILVFEELAKAALG